MKPDTLAGMLLCEAGVRNESYQWQVRINRQRYGHRANFNDQTTPMPPTVLFKLELATLEAQRVLKQSESVAA